MWYRKVLITGITGYVGSNIARYIVNNMECQVIGIKRETSNMDYVRDIEDKIKLYQFGGSFKEIDEILSIEKPDIIFHLAARFLHNHTSDDIDDLINSNIRFGVYILESMKKNGVKFLINTGTSWLHYNNEEYNPVNLYAATKRAFQDILKFYTETYNLNVITLELADTYGPGDRRKKVINLLREAYLNGKVLDMSPGKQVMNFVYIDDVVSAYLHAAEIIYKQNFKNECFAVVSNENYTLQEVVGVINEITGGKLKVRWGALPYREKEFFSPWINYKILPGWQPKVKLRDGLKILFSEELQKL